MEKEDKDGDMYEEEALQIYLYLKQDDYHNEFGGDRFKRWVLSSILPAWHAKYPGILVLDNGTSHIVGMINPLTMPNKTVLMISEMQLGQ